MQIRHESETGRLNLFASQPVRLTETPSGTEIVFIDESSCQTGCLGCVNPKCMEYSSNELSVGAHRDISYNPTSYTCPANAMSWSTTDSRPKIDEASCIKCGICVDRCPLNAISYTQNGVEIKPSTNLVGYLKEGPKDQKNRDLQNRQLLQLHHSLNPHLSLRDEDAFKTTSKALSRLNDIQRSLLVRNLLLQLGIKTALRRIGDVNFRADAFIEFANNDIGVVEVESNSDSLETVRGILDDMAVVFSRTQVRPKDQTPLAVFFTLPTERQGYWQVVKDVKTVLSIDIRTLTVGALLILVWNQRKFEDPRDVSVSPDFDSKTLKPQLESILKRKIDLNGDAVQIIRPLK